MAAIGPGEASLDHAVGLDWTAWDGWIGAVIAGVLGVGGGIPQLAICYRPAGDMTTTSRRLDPGSSADRRTRGASCSTSSSLGFAVFWIWALFFASKESINRIDDRAWAERAQGICEEADGAA